MPSKISARHNPIRFCEPNAKHIEKHVVKAKEGLCKCEGKRI